MAKFRTRFIFSTLILILFTSLSYLFFIFQISTDVLRPEAVEELRTAMLVTGAIITASAIIGLIVSAFFLTRGIVRPISKLTKATQAIAKRNFDQRIKVRSYHEMQGLLENFNHMAQQLKIFSQNAKKCNQDLEKIARERTRDRKSTRLNSSHIPLSRMPSSA